jgi:hypothetical protein
MTNGALLRRSLPAGPAISLSRALILSLGILVGAGTAARAAKDGLIISNTWVRAVLPSQPAAGYFTLSNGSTKARALVGASSPACGMLMMHQSINDNGTDKMAMAKNVEVPAHGKVSFAPGGYHLMCMSPSKDVIPGHIIRITLHFKDGSALSAPFPVRGAKGMPAMKGM